MAKVKFFSAPLSEECILLVDFLKCLISSVLPKLAGNIILLLSVGGSGEKAAT